ncbi:hypothetical protein N6B72_17305 [Chryseobacterium soli]|uniref:hypothetical protein n=1 Tax=Chryseobacterium soli TaxID=445961 RepID=UPI0029555F70|nr:hypothetical protein [Chryseobacterium soli]MDV7698685.1 hypothetical protein [Chryseobacterium soli]
MNSNKINNTSEYWAEMDFDVSSYCISWNTEKAKQYLEENEEDFIYRYVLVANKYGILLPHNIKIGESVREDVLNLIKTDKTIYSKDWINFRINNLYIYGKELLYHSNIYTQRNSIIKLEEIVNADLLISYQDIIVNNNNNIYAEPITVSFFKDLFFITFCSDAFFAELNNNNSDEIIDNSETAYLNTPRFNSFLRDFIILCFEYGATDFEFDDLEYENISEQGILFDNGIVYYEDIYDSLPEEHKYKPFKEIQVELDDTNYKRYMENKKGIK